MMPRDYQAASILYPPTFLLQKNDNFTHLLVIFCQLPPSLPLAVFYVSTLKIFQAKEHLKQVLFSALGPIIL